MDQTVDTLDSVTTVPPATTYADSGDEDNEQGELSPPSRESNTASTSNMGVVINAPLVVDPDTISTPQHEGKDSPQTPIAFPESPSGQQVSLSSFGGDLTMSTGRLLRDNDEVQFIGVSKCSFPVGESFLHTQIKKELISDESDAEIISDSESLDSSEISDHDDEKVKSKKRQPPKARGELGLEDLPPIEDLHISVPHEECQAVGFIKSVVNTLVIVEAYPLTPAMDIDSVLFLAEGDKVLGQIFDVFGPVRHPHYCVRFNSKDHMDNRGVKIGELVYCAPKTPHTSFVLLARLERLKGTDASWKDDHETPIEQLEFSDDETEQAARRAQGGNEGGAPRGIPHRKKIRARNSRPPHPSNACYANRDEHNNVTANQLQGQNPYVPLNIPGFTPPVYQFRGGFNRRGGYQRGGRGFQQHQYPRPPGGYSPHYAAPAFNYYQAHPHPQMQAYAHAFQQFQYPQAPPLPPMPPPTNKQ